MKRNEWFLMQGNPCLQRMGGDKWMVKRGLRGLPKRSLPKRFKSLAATSINPRVGCMLNVPSNQADAWPWRGLPWLGRTVELHPNNQRAKQVKRTRATSSTHLSAHLRKRNHCQSSWNLVSAVKHAAPAADPPRNGGTCRMPASRHLFLLSLSAPSGAVRDV